MSIEQLGDPPDELGVVDQPVRHVDRDVQAVPDLLPLLDPAEGVLGDGERQRLDERGLLDVRDELGRRHEPVGVSSPDERLRGAHGAGADVDDRLVMDDDLPALERALEVADDASVDRAHVRERVLLARVALRRVHLPVCPGDQVTRLEAVLREQRPADRRVDLDVPAVDAVRASERLPHAADERRCLLVRPGPERDDDELVSADARDRVRRAHDRLETPSDRAQNLVPRLVAAYVVDALESVEVDDEERERLLRPARPRQRLLDAVVQQRAVRQPGQRVAQRERVRDLDLSSEEERRDPGPARQGDRDRERRVDPLLPDELEARDQADADDEGRDHRPAGTVGRNRTVVWSPQVEMLRPRRQEQGACSAVLGSSSAGRPSSSPRRGNSIPRSSAEDRAPAR